jgi:hypothetical protein
LGFDNDKCLKLLLGVCNSEVRCDLGTASKRSITQRLRHKT